MARSSYNPLLYKWCSNKYLGCKLMTLWRNKKTGHLNNNINMVWKNNLYGWRYRCHNCSKFFSDKKKVRFHMKKVHPKLLNRLSNSRCNGKNKVYKKQRKLGVFIPEELLYEILLRIPAKDLLRLKTVCKHCRFLISDHKFVNAKIGYSRPEIIYSTCQKENQAIRYYSVNMHKEGIRVEKLIHLSLEEDLCQKLTVGSSCNGLLLLTTDLSLPKTNLYIYNPVTRQCKNLPPPKYECHDWALVHDASIGKYKVVGFHTRNQKKDVLVFTEGGDKWRNLGTLVGASNLQAIGTSSSIFVKEELHWKAVGVVSGNPTFRIYSLDVAKEKVTMNELSDIIQPPRLHIFLSEVAGTLGLTSILYKDDLLETWVLKDKEKGLWEKHYNTSLQPMVKKLGTISSMPAYISWLRYSSNFSDLLIRLGNRLLLYNVKNHELKEITTLSKGEESIKISLFHQNSLVSWE